MLPLSVLHWRKHMTSRSRRWSHRHGRARRVHPNLIDLGSRLFVRGRHRYMVSMVSWQKSLALTHSHGLTHCRRYRQVDAFTVWCTCEKPALLASCPLREDRLGWVISCGLWHLGFFFRHRCIVIGLLLDFIYVAQWTHTVSLVLSFFLDRLHGVSVGRPNRIDHVWVLRWHWSLRHVGIHDELWSCMNLAHGLWAVST